MVASCNSPICGFCQCLPIGNVQGFETKQVLMVKLVHKIQFAENTSSQNLNQVSSEFIINDPTNCGPQWPSVYGKSKWKTFCVIHNDIELISDQFYIFGDHDHHRGNCRASSERPLIGALGSLGSTWAAEADAPQV